MFPLEVCRMTCYITRVLLTEDHWKVAGLLVPIRGIEICRRAQRTCGNLQGACSRLGTDLGLHGILRGFPGSVSWHTCCRWRLWLQGLDFIRSCRENQKIVSGTCQRKTCNDGHHRHVFPGAFACSRFFNQKKTLLGTCGRTTQTTWKLILVLHIIIYNRKYYNESLARSCFV